MDKLNSKLIIYNHTNLSDLIAMDYVLKVIREGKVSKTSQGDQYCFATLFESGIAVETSRRNDTYTFHIFDKGEK